MRTQEEIVARIEERKPFADFFGAEIGDLVICLDYEHAKPHLKEGVTEEEWDEDKTSAHPTEVLKRAREYMPFALGKCVGHRGLSANRSIAHFRAWMWLAGKDEIVELLDDPDQYPQYGAPMLAKLCEVLEVDPAEHLRHEGAFLRMAQGKHCEEDGCDMGCGL